MILKAYSKAMYSTWIYYSPLKTLFDAGEGVNFTLEGKLLSVKNVIITHGHTDHFTGLHNILVTKFREAQNTGEYTPLTIYFPEKDKTVVKYLSYLTSVYKLSPYAEFPVYFVPMRENSRYEFRTKRKMILETFPVFHTKNVSSLGVKIIELRKKLKPEFLNEPPEKIKQLIIKYGHDKITYLKEHCLIAYTGDSMPINPDYIKETDILIHESTFLAEHHREAEFHSTIEEATKVAIKVSPTILILFHFSSRYTKGEIKKRIKLLKEKYKITFKIYAIFPQEVFELN